MTYPRRNRPAADVALGYAADERGAGIAYLAINNGGATSIVRLPFTAVPLPSFEELAHGYAAVAAAAAYIKARGFARVRVRIADARVATDLNGGDPPPKALAMAYVNVRCALRSLGSVRLEVGDQVEVRDLAARALAEVRLHVAA